MLIANGTTNNKFYTSDYNNVINKNIYILKVFDNCITLNNKS